MSEYQHSVTVNAPSNAVFDFVTDVRNLPKYLPTVRSAQPQSGERVRVQGEAGGHTYDSDGPFRVDREAMRMEWGSDGERHYTGWLMVEDQGRESCTVTCHLSFSPLPQEAQRMQEQSGDTDTTIQQGLEDALTSIQNECEGVGGKVESNIHR